MILTVHHTTRYRYDAPVRWILQSLRMTPSMSDGQDIINWDVSVPGATFGASSSVSADSFRVPVPSRATPRAARPARRSAGPPFPAGAASR